ncbi:hypothetical protein D7Z26_24155 [Cohnella endophytica]|uniref:DUF5666 domain-containing protein n=1 Tax=Cohnella endophytica TaxID=2419778 RepID=A0A494X7K3_9BACL|nr:hypothetical protein [Cohnella endophytica]RKP46705.1 hypothetical protein D7Z26_24155 [Cohnella endophytica]
MLTKNSILAVAMASLLLLAGCGGGGNSANNAGAAAQGQGQDGQAANGAPNRGGSPMMSADLIGKIKSVNGQTVTVYKSSFVPGARGGNGQWQGRGTQQQQQGGTQNGGDAQQSNGAQGGELPPQGDGTDRPQRGMADMFTDETEDIQLTDATKIVKTTFENNERKETVLSAADLKEGDIVSIDLEDGTQNAATITLNEGGFGGFGGGMGGGGRRGQQPDDAPAASAQASGN